MSQNVAPPSSASSASSQHNHPRDISPEGQSDAPIPVSLALRNMPRSQSSNSHDNHDATAESTAGVTTQSERETISSEARSRQKGKAKQGDASIPEHKQSWFSRTREKYGTIELENKGSTARDHLALERTFLAWLRTSLAFSSIGIAVTQLFRLNATISPTDPNDAKRTATLRHMGKPLGATFLGVSIVVLFIGMNRYYESQQWLLKGKFPASRGSILLLSAITALLIISSLVIVLVVEPTLRAT